MLCLLAAASGVLAISATSAGGSSRRLVILDYPYGRQCPAAGYRDRGDRWNMNTCNCTSYVAWALQANGRRVDWFQLGRMDAWNWPHVAREAGIGVGRVPEVGAVVVWPFLSPPFGHVAFVTGVHGNGTFDVAEYNLERRYRFDARYRVSAAGATFIYVPREA
jgi:surface antigen